MQLNCRKEIEKLPTVADVERRPFHRKFPREDQTEKLKLIGEIKQEVAPLKFNPPDLQPVNIDDLSSTLYSLYGYLGAALDEIMETATQI